MSPGPAAAVHRSLLPSQIARSDSRADADADSEDGVEWDVVSSVFADNSVDFRSS